MLSLKDFHNYQRVALKHIMDNPKSGLLLEMGLGKTAVTLTCINYCLYRDYTASKVLVIGPLRVVQSVWSQEASGWNHLKHLTFSKVLGSADERAAALRQEADIYLVNLENVAWLQAHYKTGWPFDMVILDESSSFKDPSSKRFRALRQNLGRIQRLIILTGTPVGNGLMDLWAQIYVLDQGARLYDTITQYRMRFFHNPQYKYIPVKGAEELIYEKVQDVVISMKNADYLQLPERVDTVVPVIFDEKLQDRYDEFERECVMQMAEDKEITAVNSGVLAGKLLQFACGDIYDGERHVHTIHDLKLNALEEIINSAGGKPVLVFYSYQHSMDRIIKRFKARIIKTDADVVAWNVGEIGVGVMHPKSAYGLNMQQGGANIIAWFGPTWSLEQHDQAIARLLRQGQKSKKVYIYYIVAEQTMDREVISAIERKAKGQNALMEAVKARVEKYYTEFEEV